jgi:hypothetical protein
MASAVAFAMRATSAAATPLAFQITDSSSGPCGSSWCVSVSWLLGGTSTALAQSFSLPLPQPDPTAWVAASALLQASPSSGRYYGVFDSGAVAGLPTGGYPFVHVGHADIDLLVEDQNRAALYAGQIATSPECNVPPPPGDIVCGDGNNGFARTPRSFGAGELVWTSQPLGVGYRVNVYGLAAPLLATDTVGIDDWTGTVSIVYDPVPEPTAAMLVLGGVSALAAGARRSARAFPLSRTASSGRCSRGRGSRP